MRMQIAVLIAVAIAVSIALLVYRAIPNNAIYHSFGQSINTNSTIDDFKRWANLNGVTVMTVDEDRPLKRYVILLREEGWVHSIDHYIYVSPGIDGRIVNLTDSYINLMPQYSVPQITSGLDRSMRGKAKRRQGSFRLAGWSIKFWIPVYAKAKRLFLILENGSSLRGHALIQRLKKQDKRIVLLNTPVHASCLNQVEVHFSLVQRQVLTPNDFATLEEFRMRLRLYEELCNCSPNPFQWKFTREKLEQWLQWVKPHFAELQIAGNSFG